MSSPTHDDRTHELRTATHQRLQRDLELCRELLEEVQRRLRGELSGPSGGVPARGQGT